MQKGIQAVENVKKSTAKNVIEPSEENAHSLLSFDLPEVTQTAQDFIQDDIEPLTGEAGLNESVIEVDENSEAEKHRGTKDKKGNPYDPVLHAFPPEMTGKLGKWKRKPKAQQAKAIVDDVKPNSSFRSEADKFAKLFANLHMLPFGKNGGIQDVEELVPLTDDLERYMQENGHTNISAGWAVALSAGLYSVGVCQREPNAVKVKRWLSSGWDKIKGLFGKKKKPVYDTSLDNHRTKAETSEPPKAPQTNEAVVVNKPAQVNNSFTGEAPEAGGGF